MPNELQKKGIEWAEATLADPEKLKKEIAKDFAATDADGSGHVDMAEAYGCIERVCGDFQLPMPKETKINELFKKCDKSGDGEIQLDEFGKYFKIVLDNVVKKAKAASDEDWMAAAETHPTTEAPAADAPPMLQALGPLATLASKIGLSTAGADAAKEAAEAKTKAEEEAAKQAAEAKAKAEADAAAEAKAKLAAEAKAEADAAKDVEEEEEAKSESKYAKSASTLAFHLFDIPTDLVLGATALVCDSAPVAAAVDGAEYAMEGISKRYSGYLPEAQEEVTVA